ncbi:hypothetical protein D3C80_2219460 [compost metagenome]
MMIIRLCPVPTRLNIRYGTSTLIPEVINRKRPAPILSASHAAMGWLISCTMATTDRHSRITELLIPRYWVV